MLSPRARPKEWIDAFVKDAKDKLKGIGQEPGRDIMRTGRIGSRIYNVANTAQRPVLVVRMKPFFAVPVV